MEAFKIKNGISATRYLGSNGTETAGSTFDFSGGSYTSKSFSIVSQDGTPEGIYFKSDGTTMYMVGSATDAVYQYSLSTAWDVSSAYCDVSSFHLS